MLPSTPVVVRAVSGTLNTVTLTDAQGKAIAGVQGQHRRLDLVPASAPDTAYVTAKAFGVDGSPSTVTSSFRTLEPKVTATYGILNSGMTVGVGMPVSIQFDSAVTTEAMRAEVERRVSVTTEPKQAGAWGGSTTAS